jgi:hypothetical protein
MKEESRLHYTTLDDATVMMHELFLSLQKAGFSETQALRLVLGLTRD